MATLIDLSDWMDEHSKPHIVWYVKRLAANDTLASGAHQAGPYIAKDFFIQCIPLPEPAGSRKPGQAL